MKRKQKANETKDKTQSIKDQNPTTLQDHMRKSNLVAGAGASASAGRIGAIPSDVTFLVALPNESKNVKSVRIKRGLNEG